LPPSCAQAWRLACRVLSSSYVPQLASSALVVMAISLPAVRSSHHKGAMCIIPNRFVTRVTTIQHQKQGKTGTHGVRGRRSSGILRGAEREGMAAIARRRGSGVAVRGTGATFLRPLFSEHLPWSQADWQFIGGNPSNRSEFCLSARSGRPLEQSGPHQYSSYPHVEHRASGRQAIP
jgi:hypothetical protein